MGPRVIDGRSLAAELKERLAVEVEKLRDAGGVPGLATVLVGSPAEAEVYERRLRSLAGELGYRYACERLPADAEEAEVIATVGKLKEDPRVSGILVLKPLPDHVSEAAVYRALDPLKDIEAVHPVNAGLLALGRPRYVPSTPAAAFYMLDRYLASSGRDPAEFYSRTNVVFVGRSNNVGKPAVSLGFLRNATVISCDEHAYNAGRLAEFTTQADVLIVAAGVPGLIKREHVREGVIAIDIGINPVEDPRTGKQSFVGDLEFSEVATRAEALSPVPGGVGPITDVWLLKNTADAARISTRAEAARRSLEVADTDDIVGTGTMSVRSASARGERIIQ
ncbi:MAG: bifunctional 5,10-methylene-tetrahydrofolate dehydrogenase/5,10-methylene-tetrahydrofolate cyclohydrolase [Actinomycetota bacterium]|nr:bifunctional 5,10-methylene-tetrahydrofolate dehydrogenase/5,10-methylene-tetrahydrofolate cyclohydrolase [Actinomycetota bacterium]